MACDEISCINNLALIEAGISGVKNAFGFAQNPDVLNTSMLPCVLHFPPMFRSKPRAMHNLWDNQITIMSIAFVAPRQQQGGRLKFLENSVMQYLPLWRQAFQDDNNLKQLLSNTASIRCWLNQGNYGSGGNFLTFGGTEFLGAYFQFVFQSA